MVRWARYTLCVVLPRRVKVIPLTGLNSQSGVIYPSGEVVDIIAFKKPSIDNPDIRVLAVMTSRRIEIFVNLDCLHHREFEEQPHCIYTITCSHKNTHGIELLGVAFHSHIQLYCCYNMVSLGRIPLPFDLKPSKVRYFPALQVLTYVFFHLSFGGRFVNITMPGLGKSCCLSVY